MPLDLDYLSYKKDVFDIKNFKLDEKILPKIDCYKILADNVLFVFNEDLQFLKDYKWRAKKDPQKELLCVKVDFADDGKKVKKLTTIKKADITCWNLFWRFFGYGKLAGIDYSLSGVAEHVIGNIIKDKQTQEFIRIPADSPAIENIQKIYVRIKPNAVKDTLNKFLDFISQPAVEEKEEAELAVEEKEAAEPVAEKIELQEQAPKITLKQHQQHVVEMFSTPDYREVKLKKALPKIIEWKNYLNQDVAPDQRKEVLDCFVDEFSLCRPGIAALRLILLGLNQLNETQLLKEFKETLRRFSSDDRPIETFIPELDDIK